MTATAKLPVIGLNKREPSSIADAQGERAALVEEIQRLQAWISGVATDGNGMKVSSQDYHRQRADVIRRLTQAQHRAGFLRKWIHANGCDEHINGAHPNKALLAKCYAALVRYGDEHQELLDAIELQIPMPLLEEAIGVTE